MSQAVKCRERDCVLMLGKAFCAFFARNYKFKEELCPKTKNKKQSNPICDKQRFKKKNPYFTDRRVTRGKPRLCFRELAGAAETLLAKSVVDIVFLK